MFRGPPLPSIKLHIAIDAGVTGRSFSSSFYLLFAFRFDIDISLSVQKTYIRVLERKQSNLFQRGIKPGSLDLQANTQPRRCIKEPVDKKCIIYLAYLVIYNTWVPYRRTGAICQSVLLLESEAQYCLRIQMVE